MRALSRIRLEKPSWLYVGDATHPSSEYEARQPSEISASPP